MDHWISKVGFLFDAKQELKSMIFHAGRRMKWGDGEGKAGSTVSSPTMQSFA